MKLEQTIEQFVKDSSDIELALSGKSSGFYSPDSLSVRAIKSGDYGTVENWQKERFFNICREYKLTHKELKYKLLQYQLDQLK